MRYVPFDLQQVDLRFNIILCFNYTAIFFKMLNIHLDLTRLILKSHVFSKSIGSSPNGYSAEKLQYSSH
jgi:hypothetical protein